MAEREKDVDVLLQARIERELQARIEREPLWHKAMGEGLGLREGALLLFKMNKAVCDTFLSLARERRAGQRGAR
jgi:hypothetical protein